MKTVVIAYCATLFAFVGLDFIWLSVAGDRLYRPILKDILLDSFRPAPAAFFYLLFAAGLVILAVRPALDQSSLRLAASNGALLGFFAYATYDLTNQATLRNWSTSLTLADLAWGTALSAAAATLGYLVARSLAA